MLQEYCTGSVVGIPPKKLAGRNEWDVLYKNMLLSRGR